jgi:Domain of unknown function (DUF1992)
VPAAAPASELPSSDRAGYSRLVDFLARIAEARIAEAMERGDFEDLPGKGRPLELEDLSRLPADMRLSYKVLRNADVVPPEVELRRELYSLGRLIDATTDEAERADLRRRRSLTELHYSLLLERRAARRSRA